MSVVFKFSEESIDMAKQWLGQPDQQYLKFFKAVLAIDGEGVKRIELTQEGYQHRLLLKGYDSATDDLVVHLRIAMKQLNNIIRNQSYLVPSTALGFDTKTDN